MKTSLRSMVLMAMLAGGGTCLADTVHERGTHAAAKPQSEEIKDSTMEFSYPFKMMGRAGVTVLRTPIIIGETLAGERRFISEEGLMMKVDRDEPRHERKKAPGR